MTIPATATPDATTKDGLRPHLSAAQYAKREPKKHPAWRTLTMLLWRSAAVSLLIPYILGNSQHDEV